jgi:hypothetical protein
MRIEKYGAGGEKLSQAQMQLLEIEPIVSEMIEQDAGKHFWHVRREKCFSLDIPSLRTWLITPFETIGRSPSF